MHEVPNSFEYLLLGYTGIWLLLSIYVVRLVARLNRAERILRSIEQIKE